MTYQPHSMLVTGGAGFIGANFIHYMLCKDSSVKIVNLDKLTYASSLSNLENLTDPKRYHFIQGDICNAELITQLLKQHRIDTIVHFAAESHVDRSILTPRNFVETNVLGTFTLLEAAKKYWLEDSKRTATQCRFHHISTDEVFGSLQPTESAFQETTPYQPNSPYSASKASSDHLVRAYYHTYALPITISNCSNNYGPYQHAEKFIPTIINACLKGQPIPIYGNGKNIRDWLYVEDHCRAIHKILTHGSVGENYNIGGQEEWENLTLANLICQLMDNYFPRKHPHAALLKFVTDRPGHDFRYAIDNSKISKELAWQPEESLATGMEKTIRYYADFSVEKVSSKIFKQQK